MKMVATVNCWWCQAPLSSNAKVCPKCGMEPTPPYRLAASAFASADPLNPSAAEDSDPALPAEADSGTDLGVASPNPEFGQNSNARMESRVRDDSTELVLDGPREPEMQQAPASVQESGAPESLGVAGPTSEAARFCDQCGASLLSISSRYCAHCGAPVPSNNAGSALATNIDAANRVETPDTGAAMPPGQADHLGDTIASDSASPPRNRGIPTRPGYYPDPVDPSRRRYWTGSDWGAQESPPKDFRDHISQPPVAPGPRPRTSPKQPLPTNTPPGQNTKSTGWAKFIFIGIGIAVVLVSLIGLGSLSRSGTTPTLNTADVQNAISRGLADKLGSGPFTVTCPQNLHAHQGGVFDCRVTDSSDGSSATVSVTQTNDNGKFDWEVTATSRSSASASQEAAAQARWDAYEPWQREATCLTWRAQSHSDFFSVNPVPEEGLALATKILDRNC